MGRWLFPACGEVPAAGGGWGSPKLAVSPIGNLSSPLDSQVPRHVGIIMDGNGRWARGRGHPASFGHRAGVRSIKRVLQACEDFGVHALSIYAFSTENWARPRAEVRALMRLFHETMQREVDEAAISARMYQPVLPDPDLIIRTAGEHRVSNFLLWQGAYAEMLVTETLWPDFGADDLRAALDDYASRVRRFGARPTNEIVS